MAGELEDVQNAALLRVMSAPHYDVIVVGAGVMGACTAYSIAKCVMSYLKHERCNAGVSWGGGWRNEVCWDGPRGRAGRSVLVVEQFDFLHRRGSSHGDSRITRKTYMQEHYVALMVRRGVVWQSRHGFSPPHKLHHARHCT